MVKYQRAIADQTRINREKQLKASKILLNKHKTKNIKNLSKSELDEIVITILQILELADENGNII